MDADVAQLAELTQYILRVPGQRPSGGAEGVRARPSVSSLRMRPILMAWTPPAAGHMLDEDQPRCKCAAASGGEGSLEPGPALRLSLFLERTVNLMIGSWVKFQGQ